MELLLFVAQLRNLQTRLKNMIHIKTQRGDSVFETDNIEDAFPAWSVETKGNSCARH